VKALDDGDLLLLAAIVEIVKEEEDTTQLAKAIVAEEEQRANKKKRATKDSKDRKFTEIVDENFSDQLFRRYFRMDRACFFRLCSLLCEKLGKEVFVPEEDLEETNRKHIGAVKKSGGSVCGEIRVAIFLRMLAGASYLDLMVIFKLSHDPIFRSFRMVCQWINDSLTFPFVSALQREDTEYFETISEGFSHGATSGVFTGVIGALDGIAIRIAAPTKTNSLTDPAAYYCRKGFYALNCQAICDDKKRITWLSSRHIGSCHDSVAFTDTNLYSLLQEKRAFLEKYGFFLAADSAYNMQSFLLVPHERPAPKSMEDAYNYYHSNCRIRIECTFGELIMRWGIFWRPLKMNIATTGDIISAAALIHNFLIDDRESAEADRSYFSSFSHTILLEDDASAVSHRNSGDPTVPAALVTDNHSVKPRGRPSNAEAVSREKGKAMRNSLTVSLNGNGLERPLQPGFKYNDYGMIYMEY
jgi:hypothetical protein